ncbi:uncharacterized protein LOC128351131 isoform X1 [Hemicordylus capensis]|uniref:uncharacterized protein LOC128351131 isoform X1 n=1 Tax=Hemicordylus capensis TaxID=884348 RepID=UPI0023046385|nr:uncharacterized protein LOC128351131 isoform X1 [Hemicordylus capensis]
MPQGSLELPSPLYPMVADWWLQEPASFLASALLPPLLSPPHSSLSVSLPHSPPSVSPPHSPHLLSPTHSPSPPCSLPPLSPPPLLSPRSPPSLSPPRSPPSQSPVGERSTPGPSEPPEQDDGDLTACCLIEAWLQQRNQAKPPGEGAGKDELGNIEEDPVPHHLFSLCTEAIAFLRALLANGTDDVILDHYNNIVQELQPVLTRSRSLKTNKPTVYSKSWFDKDCSNAQSELIIAYQASRGCPSFATVVNLLARLT